MVGTYRLLTFFRLRQHRVLAIAVDSEFDGSISTLGRSNRWTSRLVPAGYICRDGRPGRPKGDFTLTTMDSFAAWDLVLRGRLITTSGGNRHSNERGLRLLIGRRLQVFEIEPSSRSTRLTFSRGLTLLTESLRKQLYQPPHWMLRLPKSGPDNWPAVVATG